MLSKFFTTLLSPKTLTVVSVAGSAVGIGAGCFDGEPFSTLSYVGVMASISAAAVYAALMFHDLKSRLDSLDGKKEA